MFRLKTFRVQQLYVRAIFDCAMAEQRGLLDAAQKQGKQSQSGVSLIQPFHSWFLLVTSCPKKRVSHRYEEPKF